MVRQDGQDLVANEEEANATRAGMIEEESRARLDPVLA